MKDSAYSRGADGSELPPARDKYSAEVGVAAFSLSAGVIAGEYARVSYDGGFLEFECGGRLTPEERRRVFLEREAAEDLARRILACNIETWPHFDAAPPPLGWLMPKIELQLADGTALRWSGRKACSASAWAEVESAISQALGRRFSLDSM